MKKSLIFWGERYLFSPDFSQKIISLLLTPLSLLYCLIVWVKFKKAKPEDFGIKVVSVGNLIVGGSGKTPVTVALASRYERVAIVLRGYGRESQGLHLVSDGNSILCDVKCSGDEAMLYAYLLPKAVVIVAEDRVKGVLKAKEMGIKLVFLDDAYSKHFIQKLDLLILSKQKNNFCLPSGPFRERLWKGKEAILIEEKVDFKRHVKITNSQKKMILVTAISKPERLDAYLSANVIEKVYFPDHYAFNEEELKDILVSSQADTLLVTRKDAVKMKDFNLSLSFLELDIELNEQIHQSVQEYVKIPSTKPERQA